MILVRKINLKKTRKYKVKLETVLPQLKLLIVLESFSMTVFYRGRKDNYPSRGFTKPS